MEVEREKLPTVTSLAENTIYIVRVGNDKWSQSTSAAMRQMEDSLRIKFTSINLSELNPFDLHDSPLAKIGDWSQGSIRFSFVSSDEDPTKWSLLYPNKRAAIVLGLLHCPSSGQDLGEVFEQFQSDAFKRFPYLDDTAVRCCCFDISEDQQQRVSALLDKGMEVFPPSSSSSSDDPTKESAVQFHMRFVLRSASSRLIKRHEMIIRDCDAMADAMKKTLLRRSSSGLSIPGGPSSPQAASNIPSMKDPESCRLFSGSPSFPGDSSHPFATTLTSLAARKSARALQARLFVWTGKHCLLAGSPLDAVGRFTQGSITCRTAEENVWEAVCHEALACCREICLEDGLALDAALSTHADLFDASMALLLKSSHNSAVRKLIADTCVRAAHSRLSKGGGDQAAIEALSVARRVHAEQPTFAWYMTVEALLWNRHGEKRMQLMCVMDAFNRFMLHQEPERAYRVVEEDFAQDLLVPEGVVPFNKRNVIMGVKTYSYPGMMILRRLVKSALKQRTLVGGGADDQKRDKGDRFTFYAFQLLGMFAEKKKKQKNFLQAEEREEVLKVVSEMTNNNTADVVVTIDASFATLPMIESVQPMLVHPTPSFDLMMKDEKKSSDVQQQASVFLYSPFRPLPDTASSPSPARSPPATTGSPFALSPPPRSPSTPAGAAETTELGQEEAEEVLWVVGEDCFVTVKLRNVFDIPVSCTLGFTNNPPTKVVVSGRSMETVKLGPVQFNFEEETLVLEMISLGARFLYRLPLPTCVHNMPLLVREKNDKIGNLGKGKAFLLNAEGGITSEVDPGQHVAVDSQDLLRYCNRKERPRVVRRLVPNVPEISAIKISRCDTMDHLLHGSTASAMVTMNVLDESLIGKEIRIRSRDDSARVWGSTKVGASHLEVKVIIPPWEGEEDAATEEVEQEEIVGYADLYSRLDFELDGTHGSFSTKKKKLVSVLTTAPPRWCSHVHLRVDVKKEPLRVLDFCTVGVDWSLPIDTVGLIQFELVAYRRKKEAATYERCDEDDVVWSGASTWGCLASSAMSSNRVSVAFLKPNDDYVIAWNAVSKMRVRWWLKCVHVAVL